MNLYAESSAIAAWMLHEPTGRLVIEALLAVENVFASELTLIECDRVLIRALHRGELSEGDAENRAARLAGIAQHWHLLRLDGEIIERARRPFPAEPIRTLDALHLASALVARRGGSDLAVLSLDQRVRRNAKLLGLAIQPEAI